MLTKNSFPLTDFSNTTKHLKTRKDIFTQDFLSKQMETWLKIGHPNEYKIISNHNCNFNFQGVNLMQRLQKPK